MITMALTMTQPSIIFKRMIFHTKYQKENESLSDFATSLKTLLRACQYEADFMFLDGLARDRFIAGIADKELQAFLTTQPASISLDEIVDLCTPLQNSAIKTENQQIIQRCSSLDLVDVNDVLPSCVQNVTNVLDIRFANENDDGVFGDQESFKDSKNAALLIPEENTQMRCYFDYNADDSLLGQHSTPKEKGKKSFKCEQCDFSTGWKCSLRKHLTKVHDSEPINFSYVCDKCGFTTKFSRAYKNHLMSLKISGKCELNDEKQNPDQSKQTKPMKCPHCNYTRTQRSKILNHIKSVHEDAKPFKCSQCSSSFKLKFRLTAHIKLSHGDGKVLKILLQWLWISSDYC